MTRSMGAAQSTVNALTCEAQALAPGPDASDAAEQRRPDVDACDNVRVVFGAGVQGKRMQLCLVYSCDVAL